MSQLSDWRDKAACLEEDPELFFPSGTTGIALEQAERAKAVCRRCPVITQCLKWAMVTHQNHGVLGGMSEDERGALRRSRERATNHAGKRDRMPPNRGRRPGHSRRA